MTHQRHLTSEERLVLKDLLEAVGVVEVLRGVGAYVGHTDPDLARGGSFRSRLYKIAVDIQKAAEEVSR
jgi:hypothetical protein